MPTRFGRRVLARTDRGPRARTRATAASCADLSGASTLVAVVSDGAGSAERSHVGADLACSCLVETIKALIGSGGRTVDVTRGFVVAWLEAFRRTIAAYAEAEARPVRDFACTVVAAVIGDDASAFLQVGDGAIVLSCAAEPADHAYVFWPQEGEYANQTNFATEAVADSASSTACSRSRLARRRSGDSYRRPTTPGVGFRTRPVYPRFPGDPRPVRQAPLASRPPSRWPSAISSAPPGVNDRTDDDKTLVLATRRGARDATPPGPTMYES